MAYSFVQQIDADIETVIKLKCMQFGIDTSHTEEVAQAIHQHYDEQTHITDWYINGHLQLRLKPERVTEDVCMYTLEKFRLPDDRTKIPFVIQQPSRLIHL